MKMTVMPSGKPVLGFGLQIMPALIVGIAVLSFSGRAAHGQPPSLAGTWRTASGKIALVLTQDGAKLKGHIESEGMSDEVEGGAASTGVVILGEYMRRENSLKIPDEVWNGVLKTRGVAHRPGAVRGEIKLQYDAEKNELKGTREALSVTYSATPPHPVRRINVAAEAVTFTRATNLPDLEVREFSSVDDRFNEAAPKRVWDIRAMIRNSGTSDTLHIVRVRLEAGFQKPGERAPQFSALSPWIEVPALPANITTWVLWTSGELSSPAGGTYAARFTPSTDVLNLVAWRVVADPEKTIEESSESNNRKTLWRLDAAPCARSVWTEIPPIENDKATASEKFRQWRIEAAEPAQAVLCYIKMEAQRRAKRGAGSVAGSNMMRALTTDFLKEYLANPTASNAEKAIEDISAYQGIPGVRGTLWVPAGIRARYPELPKTLVPATHFHIIRGKIMGEPVERRGKNIQRLPTLDVPFLVGADNLGTGHDADVSGGGRNSTNVMHWATGIKYGALPKDGLRTLFIGYELWHLEGWDTFSEDPINDLIGEEQGRMLGARLRGAGVASPSELAYALDEDFKEARAWVGALLRERSEQLDAVILAPTPPKTNQWWGFEGMKPGYSPPWGGSNKNVRQQLAAGKSVEEVAASTLVDRLVQIYTLIYEVEEWEKRTGKTVQLTDVMRRAVRGEYDSQFRSVSKNNEAEWDWQP